MNQEEIRKRRLQLLNKDSKPVESSDIEINNNDNETKETEDYEQPQLLEPFEIDDSQVNKRNSNKISMSKYKEPSYSNINSSNTNANGNNNNNMQYNFNERLNDCISKLKSIPRHYYDPFHDSEIHIRIAFYCLCTITILIFFVLFYASF